MPSPNRSRTSIGCSGRDENLNEGFRRCCICSPKWRCCRFWYSFQCTSFLSAFSVLPRPMDPLDGSLEPTAHPSSALEDSCHLARPLDDHGSDRASVIFQSTHRHAWPARLGHVRLGQSGLRCADPDFCLFSLFHPDGCRERTSRDGPL